MSSVPFKLSRKGPLTAALEFGLTVICVLTALYAVPESLSFSPGARWFPLFTSGALLLFATILLVSQGFALRKRVAAARSGRITAVDLASKGYEGGASHVAGSQQDTDQQLRQGFFWLGMLAVFAAAIVFINFFVATFVWLGVLLRFGAAQGWQRAVLIAAVSTALFWLVADTLSLVVP